MFHASLPPVARPVLRACAGAAVLLVLAGCASSKPDLHWSKQTAREIHSSLPTLDTDPMKPLVIVHAGPDGRPVSLPAGSAQGMVREGNMLVLAPSRAGTLNASR